MSKVNETLFSGGSSVPIIAASLLVGGVAGAIGMYAFAHRTSPSHRRKSASFHFDRCMSLFPTDRRRPSRQSVIHQLLDTFADTAVAECGDLTFLAGAEGPQEAVDVSALSCDVTLQLPRPQWIDAQPANRPSDGGTIGDETIPVMGSNEANHISPTMPEMDTRKESEDDVSTLHGLLSSDEEANGSFGAPPPRTGTPIDAGTFSHRRFYHTSSGAIISRLPRKGSVRRESIQHLLHAGGSRQPRPARNGQSGEENEENEDGGDGRCVSPLGGSLPSLPDNPIYRVVITGGPCSGKTTCMAHLRREFERRDFNVLCVPEVATLLFGGGVNLVFDTVEERITLQRVILQVTMMLEDAFYELASMQSRPSLILYDRGTMDGSAYCTPEEWDAILQLTGYTNEELSDARYDAVVHLMTAAIGAEAHYTLANNAARSEGLEDARRCDANTRNAWRGHFLLCVIDNVQTSFERKLQRVVHFIGCVLGISMGDEEPTPTAALSASSSPPTSVAPPPSTATLPLNGDTKRSGGGGGKAGRESMATDVRQMAFLATGARVVHGGVSLKAVQPQRPAPSPTRAAQKGSVEGGLQTVLLAEAEAPRLSVGTRLERSNLHRHFFISSVESDHIPSNAVVVDIVIITLRPTKQVYGSEKILRRVRPNGTQPMYFRRVEYKRHRSGVDATMEEQTMESETKRNSGSGFTSTRSATMRRITKAAFQRLARQRDTTQPVIQKRTIHFFYHLRHFTLVSFQRPRELDGLCRLVTTSDTAEDDIPEWIEVEPISLVMRDGVM